MRFGRGSTDSSVVYLHIGTPKSGTTYLQSRFETNPELAAAQGLLWPGPRWGKQVEAVRSLRLVEPGTPLDPEGGWMELVESVRAWPGSRTLISMEWMAGCTPTQVEAAVRSFAPARVEVICTCRDLLRTFVAQWQEMTKNCRPWSWEQFVGEVVTETPGEASDQFWRQQDVPSILKTWAKRVPWERIHLVTLPPRGAEPGILWNRFCSIIGLDGTGFEQPPRANESLGVVSAALMHRLNLVALDAGMERMAYQKTMHRRLAEVILGARRDKEDAIAVSPEVDRWIRARSQRQIKEIGKFKLHLVGDLDELRPGAPLVGREPTDVSEAELLEASLDALVGMAQDQYQMARRRQRQNPSRRGTSHDL